MKSLIKSFSLVNYISIIAYSLPFLIVSGPFMSDLAISILAVYFLFIIIIKKEYKYIKIPLVYLFFIWLLYLILRSLFSENPLLSLESSLFYVRFGLFSLAVWYLIDNNKKFLTFFSYSLLTIFIILILDSLIQFFFGKNILGNEYSAGRLSSLFGDELILGSFLSRILPLLIGLLLYKKIDIKFNFFLILMVISIVFISGERTAFFYVILASLSIIIFTKKLQYIIYIFISLITIITLLTLFNPLSYDRVIERTLSDINIEGKDKYLFSRTHQAIYETSFNIFLSNSIFGIGPKMYRVYCSKEEFFVKKNRYINGCSTHPHNTYMQLAAEIGIVGTLPVLFTFILITGFLLKNCINSYLYNDSPPIHLNCIGLTIFISLFPFIPSGSFFNNMTCIVYYLPVGFFLHFYYYDYKRNNN